MELTKTRHRSREITKEDIIEKISTRLWSDLVEETYYRNDNHEECTLIWYGNVHNEGRFETIIKPQLRNIINYFKRFQRSDRCLQFVSSIRIEQVFVILANCDRAELQQLLSKLQDIKQVVHIYIYSKRHLVINENEWFEFRKVQGIFTNTTQLLLQLMEDVKSVCILSFNVLKIDGDESSIRDLTKESLMFLRSKLLFDHLLSMPAPKSAKRDIVLQFRKEYEGNPKETTNINKFAQTYKANDAITWYTSNTCVSKIVNKALRLQDMKTIFDLRFFITDLHNQLSSLCSLQSNSQAAFTVYRGTNLPMKDLNKIIHNVGSLISMNIFFSTSCSRQVADIFHGNDKHAKLQDTLFEITLDPNFVLVPFANITTLSHFNEEEEVLFSFNLILKVDTFSRNRDGMWNIKLSTSAEQNIDINRLITSCFDNIDEIVNNIPIQNHFIKILCSMGDYNVAKEFYFTWLKEAEYDSSQTATIRYNLGYIFHQEGEVSMALGHYRKAYALLQEQLELSKQQEQTRSLLAKLCDILAGIYIKNNNYTEALKYYWSSFKIEIDRTPINYETLNKRCSNVASTYSKTRNFNTALTFFSKAISYIFILSLKNSTIFTSDVYYQIANVYEQLNNKQLTLRYAVLAFNAAIKALPTNYTNIATYKRSKEIAAPVAQSNRLSKIVPLMIKQHRIFEYGVEDLLTFEKNNDLVIDSIVIVCLNRPFDGKTLPFNNCAQKVFNNVNNCRDYLSSMKRQLIFLVLPLAPERYSVETFYEYSSVVSIYITIVDISETTTVRHHKKNRGFHLHDSQLAKTIHNDIKTFYDSIILINIFNSKKPSTDYENISFIKYYTFINLMPMVSEDGKIEQRPIDFNDFELKKTIVEQNIPKLYEYHQLIANVHSTINQQHQTTFKDHSKMLTVYYSGIISCDKLDTLEQNIGAYISINNFIVAYSDKYCAVQQAFSRAMDNLYHSHYVPIVIQFNVDTRLSTGSSFAPLDKVLRLNDQGLVFSMGSVFRLDNLRRVYRRNIMYHYLRLSLAPLDPLITKIFNQIKLEIEYDSNKLLSFGKFLYYLNEYGKAEEFFSELLHHLKPDDVHQKIVVYTMLGDISGKNLNFQNALDHYNKAIKLQFATDEKLSVQLQTVYGKIASIYLRMGKKRKSRLNYLKGIETDHAHLFESQRNLSLSFVNIGLYYVKDGQYQIANDYFKKAMQCHVNINPQRESCLSLNYFYMGISYNCLEKYQEAIECHEKALRIYLVSEMPYNRQYIKSNYYYLGLSHFRLEQYDDALICFNLVIENETDMDHIALACNYLGFIYYSRGNYEQSLKWYRISLRNVETSREAIVLHNIGAIYMNMKSNKLAREFFDNAFNCELELVTKKYPSILTYYNYIKKIEDRYQVLNETPLKCHGELEIITHLLESRNETSSTYAIIRFDPDNLIEGYDIIARLCSDEEILHYSTNCKAQTIFIITYSNLSVPLKRMEQTIYIYVLLLTDQIVVGENVRGCFNDIDQLLIQVTRDLVMLEMRRENGEQKINSQVLTNYNWRNEYFNRLRQLQFNSGVAGEDSINRQAHRSTGRTLQWPCCSFFNDYSLD